MTEEHLKPPQTLDEVYALIDKNRIDTAKAAHVKFHNDVGAAIGTITNISAVASARVQADSRVAAAKVLINAELAATHLLAEAQMEASRCAGEMLTKPSEVVEAAITEIGKLTTWRLIASARESVEAIQHDAEFAIKVLMETGANAIREIQIMAAGVAAQTKRDAEQAAAKLKEYRERTHTLDEARSEGGDVALIVIGAAEEASAHLQSRVEATLAQIHAVTEEACSVVHDAALAAEEKIMRGKDRALAHLREFLQAHLR